MNKKLLNKFIAIFNIFSVHLIFLSLLFESQEMFQEYVNIRPEILSVTLYQISDFIKLLPFIFNIVLIEILAINLIAVIQNRKSKKISMWFLTSAIYGGVRLADFDIIANYKIYILQGVLILALLINFLISIKESKITLKNLIIYLITFVLIIVSIIFGKSILIYVAFIMQLVNNKEVNDKETNSKNKKIGKIFRLLIAFVMFATIIFEITVYSIILFKGKSVYQESCAFIDKIVEGLKKETIDKDEVLLSIKKYGKYGYINRKGEEIIPCIYDETCEAFWQSDDYCFLARKENNYYVISRRGTVLNETKDAPAPFFKGKYIEELFSKEQYKMLGANSSINSIIKDYFDKDEDSDNNIDDTFSNLFVNEDVLETEDYHENNDKIICNFNLDNGNILNVEIISDEENEELEDVLFDSDLSITNISILDNDNVIQEYKKIIIPITESYSYDEFNIECTYSGFIPYYDIDNKKTGLFDKKNFEKIFEIQANYQILEKIDNLVFVRDYSDPVNIKEFIFDSEGNKLLEFKEINALEDTRGNLFGFVIKKENDKVSYYNMQMEEKLKDFDYIISAADDMAKDLLICAEQTDGEVKYSLYDINGTLITKEKYDSLDIMNEESKFNFETKRYIFDSLFKYIYNI